jgi:hypothetical protein
VVKQACFVSGIETKAGVQTNNVKLTSTQAKTIQLSVTINALPTHRNKVSKMLIVVEHKSSQGNTAFYMRGMITISSLERRK